MGKRRTHRLAAGPGGIGTDPAPGPAAWPGRPAPPGWPRDGSAENEAPQMGGGAPASAVPPAEDPSASGPPTSTPSPEGPPEAEPSAEAPGEPPHEDTPEAPEGPDPAPSRAGGWVPRGTRWAIPLLLSLSLLVVLWGMWERSQATARRQRLTAGTVAVGRRDVQLRVAAAGVIRPTTPVNISPKQPGRLAALLVDQGERVAAGQVLARMDASELEGERIRARGALAAAEANLRRLRAGNRPQEIQQARDDLAQAEADLIAVRSAYLSNRQLYGSGAISRLDADTTRSRYRAALARIEGLRARLALQRAGARREDIAVGEAEVEQARGALATIESRIGDAVIRAPFAGVVTQKYADVGAFVTPTTSASATSSATSSSILALAGALEGVANVAEADVAAVHPGQRVDLRLDAFPGRSFPATVRLVAPEAVIEQNVTSFQVRITPGPELAGRLRSGMNFTASFRVGERRGALLVPTGAIVSAGDGMGVNVAVPGRPARFVPVRVGATVGTMSEVLSGLREGERVYTTFPGGRKPNDRPVRGGSPFSAPRPGGRLPR